MTAEKDVQVARKKGRGEVIWAMPERKHSFLNEVFPNTVLFGSWKSYLKVHWLADSVTIVASSKRMLNIVHIKEIKAIVLKEGIFVLLLQIVFFLLEKKRCRSCDQDERPPTTDQTGGNQTPLRNSWKN